MVRLVDLLVEMEGWTFARRAFILPVLNWEESSTSDMARQDLARYAPVPR